jgi:UDPglucose 6-dehydrogenase
VTRVGWIGLGRLGAPCAAALAHHGKHEVFGYDLRGVDPAAYDWADQPPVKLLPSVATVVAATDGVVFVAVQTPHTREYGGEVPTPEEPREFEYGYLVQAVRDVCAAAERLRKHVTVVVVSTVLPGTFDKRLRRLLNDWVTPVYHPFFIAMGSVVEDFLEPEQVLLGVDSAEHAEPLREVYGSLHDATTTVVSIPSAELAKVAYNTFISCKIVFANSLMQLSEFTGADVDEVTEVLVRADQRITSGRYLRAGVGDGGACHPRDNVALSALARQLDVVDVMGFVSRARDDQSRWLARVVDAWAKLTRLPVVVLGRAYKPEITLVDGSPALLLCHSLAELDRQCVALDPVLHPDDAHVRLLEETLRSPHVFCVATAHQVFRNLDFAPGSVVIDPFGYLDVAEGVTLVRPGRR